MIENEEEDLYRSKYKVLKINSHTSREDLQKMLDSATEEGFNLERTIESLGFILMYRLIKVGDDKIS